MYKPNEAVIDIEDDIKKLHRYRKMALKKRHRALHYCYGRILDALIRQLHKEKGYGREEY